MKDYMMIDGRKIEISAETAANLKRELVSNPVKDILDRIDGRNFDGGCHGKTKVVKHNNQTYIVIDLPGANFDWTFAAWDLAKSLCEEIKTAGGSAYPAHYNVPFAGIQHVVLNVSGAKGEKL